jgi:hypothetical protein
MLLSEGESYNLFNRLTSRIFPTVLLERHEEEESRGAVEGVGEKERKKAQLRLKGRFYVHLRFGCSV